MGDLDSNKIGEYGGMGEMHGAREADDKYMMMARATAKVMRVEPSEEGLRAVAQTHMAYDGILNGRPVGKISDAQRDLMMKLAGRDSLYGQIVKQALDTERFLRNLGRHVVIRDERGVGDSEELGHIHGLPKPKEEYYPLKPYKEPRINPFKPYETKEYPLKPFE
jgi:hypothetical protein